MNVNTNLPEQSTLSDCVLIDKIRCGDEEAFGHLCGRYLPLCRTLARRLGAGWPECEDLSQEGMLGLIEATRRFDSGKQVPFVVYARRCMTSKMVTALQAQGTQKRRANLGVLSLDETESDLLLISATPEELLIEDEELKLRVEQITSLLSKSENLALRHYLRGYSYSQIAALCELPTKSVDNALQRVRRKLRTVL